MFYRPSPEFDALLKDELEQLLFDEIALSQQAAKGAVTCEDVNRNAFTGKIDEKGVEACLDIQEKYWLKVDGYVRHKSTDSSDIHIQCLPHTGDRVADLATARDKCNLNPDCLGFNYDMDNKQSCLKVSVKDKRTVDGKVDLYLFLPRE